MQSQNLEEYRLIRQELQSLKDCITNYFGFILGGTGIAVLGLGTLFIKGTESHIIVYISFLISLLVSFVMFILFYKFNSHNRYAGYCKLLNHERFEKQDNNAEAFHSIIAWEVCLGRLRTSEIEEKYLINLCNDENTKISDDINLVNFFIDFHKIDHGKRRKGFKLLLSTLFSKPHSTSWGFPPYVTVVFLVICGSLLLLGVIKALLLYTGDQVDTEETINLIMLITCSPVIILQIFLWLNFIGKLHILMNGSETVDSYFCRFLPIRKLFLSVYELSPKYIDGAETYKQIENLYYKKNEPNS